METKILIGLLVAVLLLLCFLAFMLSSRLKAFDGSAGMAAMIAIASEKSEREIRREIADASRSDRDESASRFSMFERSLQQQAAETARTQSVQLESFSQALHARQTSLAESLASQLGVVNESIVRRMAEVRETLDKQLQQLQNTNSTKLDEMRRTVDEKLQSTLETRLGESFKQVADRLEQVHRGLGEMQVLAQGVGDLKHLLTDVKTRGIFGEAQLSALLEQVFTVDQYAAQVVTRPGSKFTVDFAIKLPGRSDTGEPLWLPVDAKFPNEDYERLLNAQRDADGPAATLAGNALEARIRTEAKSMAEKYIVPPYTTDFAILFLPTEGLYAEVLRRPGLMESLQRDHRITLAGPTTLLAMLSSLQMGFRTLALEKRSSEVWQVLGAVKTEFGKFGDVLAKMRSQTESVLNTLSGAEQRSRVMTKALRGVESLSDGHAALLIPPETESSGSRQPDEPTLL